MGTGNCVGKRIVFCHNMVTLGLLDEHQVSVKTQLNCGVARWCCRELLGVGNEPAIWCQKHCECVVMSVKEEGRSFSFAGMSK